MSDQGVDQVPSETALFAALRRAIARKEFANAQFGPDDLAEAFLPAHYRFFLRFKKIRENTKEKLNSFLPGLNEYMIARTAYFDQLFLNALKKGIPQIVLLGAGYDSRAYRFSKSIAGTRIFELDIAPTQERKKECSRKARIDIPPSVQFVPINFMAELPGVVLGKAGYDPRKETLFIWEGVSYYLDVQSVDTMLAFASQSSHAATTLAFDYTITLTDQNIQSIYGAQAFAETMKEHHSNEELLFSIDDGKIDSFLSERGLQLIEHLDNVAIETRFLTDAGRLLGRMTGHFRFVLTSKKIISQG